MYKFVHTVYSICGDAEQLSRPAVPTGASKVHNTTDPGAAARLDALRTYAVLSAARPGIRLGCDVLCPVTPRLSRVDAPRCAPLDAQLGQG
jgi:hypothetical protein